MSRTSARPLQPNGASTATPGTDRRDEDIPLDPDADAGPTPRGRHRWANKRLDVLAAVAAGGSLGSLARYELARAFPVKPGRFPTSTLAINTTGAFVLGFLLVLLVERLPPSRYARAFLAVGVIGAFTTFSTFAVETIQLANGHVPIAAAFVAASVVSGLTAARLGIIAGRAVPHRHPPAPRHPREEPT